MHATKICCICGTAFDVGQTRKRYRDAFDGEVEYDDQYPENDHCFNCAIEETKMFLQAGLEYEAERRLQLARNICRDLGLSTLCAKEGYATEYDTNRGIQACPICG